MKNDNMLAECNRPSDLKLDGHYTKLLAAFAKMHNLVHKVVWHCTKYGLKSLVVDVYVHTKYWDSILDVFKHGHVAYVSSLREYYGNTITPYTLEEVSKKIVLGLFGPGRYIKAMKSGEGYIIDPESKCLVPNPTFIIDPLPQSEEELAMQLDLAGIDVDSINVKVARSRV